MREDLDIERQDKEEESQEGADNRKEREEEQSKHLREKGFQGVENTTRTNLRPSERNFKHCS